MTTNLLSTLPTGQVIGCVSGSNFKLNSGPVQLVKPTGQVINFGYDSSYTAAEVGTALLAAKVAAASGDTIALWMPALVTAQIAKDGVNLFLGPSAEIYRTDSTN